MVCQVILERILKTYSCPKTFANIVCLFDVLQGYFKSKPHTLRIVTDLVLGRCILMILSTLLKALLIIAIPITLVVYACLFVASESDDITQEPHGYKR